MVDSTDDWCRGSVRGIARSLCADATARIWHLNRDEPQPVAKFALSIGKPLWMVEYESCVILNRVIERARRRQKQQPRLRRREPTLQQRTGDVLVVDVVVIGRQVVEGIVELADHPSARHLTVADQRVEQG